MKILFVGNSYTFFNDMPTLFDQLAKENGKTVETLSVTKGGRRIIEHFTLQDEYTEMLNKTVSENTFDAVILQDQSLIALKEPEDFRKGLKLICEKLEGKTERVILYQTWARKEGSKVYEETGWSRDYMANGIENAYVNAAKELSAELSPVGYCFNRLTEAHPEIELYKEDRSHPSYTGSCLAAITHYRAVFGELPKALSTLDLEEDTKTLFLDTVSKAF